MQYKQDGISILIAMGTSLLVLSLAFATLNSISRSIDQASNIQRTTQLFFASESGAEAAFFHHNARGAGLEFANSTHSSQTINHSQVNANTNWSISGRTNGTDQSGDEAALVDLLKEGQTIKIPLQWDGATLPTESVPPASPNTGDHLVINFYKDPDAINSSTALDLFNDQYNLSGNAYPIRTDFDFGSDADNDILIDWSFTRKHSTLGIQTFIPSDNQDCIGFSSYKGYVCENDLKNLTAGSSLEIGTNQTTQGKILPDPGLGGGACNSPASGRNCDSLIAFWECRDYTVNAGQSCSDYQLTIRALLKFNDSTPGVGENTKIPGIPYQIRLITGDATVQSFPKSHYTVTSNVALEDFSQQISIEVPEKTSIGAFDYVIFD